MSPETLIDYDRHKTVQAALAESFRNQHQNEYFQYSAFWKAVVSERDAANDLSAFLIALSERATITEGMNWHVPDDKKRLLIDYYKTYLDAALLEQHPMSWLCAPAILDVDGRAACAPYLKHLHLMCEITDMLHAAGAPERSLDVVEIGGGFGGLAFLMLRSGMAKSYTVVDLPENLKIAAFYLTQNFKGLPFRVVSSPEPIGSPGPAAMTFVAAGNLEAIAQWRFDLAINTDSLGEMPASTATAYIKWIREHLVDGGYFFSKNGHNRGPDGVQYPHEYGYQAFRLAGLHPPTVISGMFDDFSHYILAQNAAPLPARADSRSDDACFDALCALYAAGLQDDLTAISTAFAANGLDESQRAFLVACDKVFAAPGLDAKMVLLNSFQEGSFENIGRYLRGLVKYLDGDLEGAVADLSRYLANARSYIAEAYARMVLAKREPAALGPPYSLGIRTEFALDEMRTFFGFQAPLREIALRLRADVLRKKLNYPPNYTPSALLRLKNLALNVHEGLGWTTHRAVKGARR